MEDVTFQKVSIVVLTYNSEKTISRCLSGIRENDYPREALEVLVLDNGSTDHTLKIVEDMNVKYYSYPTLNISQLRNRGVKIAQGEIVGFVDSDCIVAKDWVSNVVRNFQNEDVGIVGNEYLLPPDASYFEKNWYRECNRGLKYNDLIPAGNMAIKKCLFMKYGGFDESMQTGEDAYIAQKYRDKGIKVLSDWRIKSVHLGNAKDLRTYFKKEIWYGLGMLGTVKKGKFDKPFYITLIYFIIMLLFLLNIGIYIYDDNSIAAYGILLTGIGIIFIPLLAAAERIYVKKRKGNILYVMLTFVVFLLARFVALIYIARLLRYKKAT